MKSRPILTTHSTCIRWLVLAVVLSLPCVAAAEGGSQGHNLAGSTTLVGGRIVQPSGALEDSVAVVVRGGKIREIVSADRAKDPDVRRFGPKTVICPGLIDLMSSIGTGGKTLDTISFVDPDARVLDAIDPSGSDLQLALRSGITAAMVIPSSRNLVAGAAATFRMFVVDGQLDVLRDDGPMVFAFGEGVWQADRKPTSRAGALLELRELVAQAKQGKAHPRVTAALDGQADMLIQCSKAVDVVGIRDALGDLAKQVCFVHSEDALDLCDDLKGIKRPVVLGPYGFGSSRRQLLGPAALSRAGCDLAFAGGFPRNPPDSLRITAALAVRYGLDPAVARRAMTIFAAETAGVDDKVGSIVPGKDADLVVFSNDPLRLDARVLEVYVRGVRVYSAANQDTSNHGGQP